MWLHEFHRLFDTVTAEHFGRQQRLDRIEEQVALVWSGSAVSSELAALIETTTDWQYPSWWPKLSDRLSPPVDIPATFTSNKNRTVAVEKLYERLRHIEVVSVILRFIKPSEFGIMSPPVMSLLNLIPSRDPVRGYLDYIDTLRDLGDHHEMDRVASVEMAIWTAFYARYLSAEHRHLTEEMLADEHLLELRFKNLTRGIGQHLGSRRHRLLFATALLKREPETAALIAGRVFEHLILLIARQLRITVVAKDGRSMVATIIDELDSYSYRDLTRELVASTPKELARLWRFRTDAVHGERGTEKVSPSRRNMLRRSSTACVRCPTLGRRTAVWALVDRAGVK